MKQRVSTTPRAKITVLVTILSVFTLRHASANPFLAFESPSRCHISRLEINAFALQQVAQDLVKQQEEKVTRLQAVLAASPNNVAARSELANVLTTLGRYAEAASHFTFLLNSALTSSQRAAVLNNYGNFYFLQDSLTRAEHFYLQAAHEDSLDKKPYLNLGTLYTAVGDDSLAGEAYCEFISEDAQIALAEMLLGLTPGSDDTIRAGGESRKMNTANLKKKAGKNIRKPPRKKGRPFGKKAIKANDNIGVANYSDLESALYWAEVR